MEPIDETLPDEAVALKTEEKKEIKKETAKKESTKVKNKRLVVERFFKGLFEVFPDQLYFAKSTDLKNFIEKDFKIEINDEQSLKVYIHFPTINIKSSDGTGPHTMYDLFAIVGLGKGEAEAGRLRINRFMGCRGSLTNQEMANNYNHSHLSQGGFFIEGGFCMGSSFLGELYSRPDLDQDDLLAFLFNLTPYLQHESVEGRPYKRLKETVFRSSEISNRELPSYIRINDTSEAVRRSTTRDNLRVMQYLFEKTKPTPGCTTAVSKHFLRSTKDPQRLAGAITGIWTELADILSQTKDVQLEVFGNFILAGSVVHTLVGKSSEEEKSLRRAHSSEAVFYKIDSDFSTEKTTFNSFIYRDVPKIAKQGPVTTIPESIEAFEGLIKKEPLFKALRAYIFTQGRSRFFQVFLEMLNNNGAFSRTVIEEATIIRTTIMRERLEKLNTTTFDPNTI